MNDHWGPSELSGKLPADYLFQNRHIEGRPCACGGMVWADPDDPEPGVMAHNAEECHLAWVELEAEHETALRRASE